MSQDDIDNIIAQLVDIHVSEDGENYDTVLARVSAWPIDKIQNLAISYGIS